jgi:hypothetical protein
MDKVMDEYTTAQLLGSIDERTKNTAAALTALDVKMDGHGERLSHLESSVKNLSPVKTVVYGAIGVVLLAVIGAIVALVLQQPK